MGYAQKFKGSLRFADAHCLEVGLDRFVEAPRQHSSFVEVDDLKFEGLLVRIAVDTYGPASMYDPTMSALYALAEHAHTGYLSTEFHLDGISKEAVHPGQRASADGLPPRHHRWDVLLAADRGDAEALRAVQALGVDLAITFEHYHGYSPLHLAARAGSVAAVELLLAAGIPADVSPGEHGVAPLGLAATAAVARALVAAGANVNREAGDNLAIWNAAAYGRDDVVLALLELGAVIPQDLRQKIVNACCRHAKLEALLALIARDPALVPCLADPDAMTAATTGGEPVVVDLVLQHGGVLPDTFLTDAIAAKAPALVEMALRAPDALARCGDSSHRGDAMVRAAADGSIAVMELLARHGVPTHPATPGETSPIHAALGTFDDGRAARIDWLLAHGAPRDAVTASGKTLMQAAYSEMKAHLVIAHGFDPATIDREDMAPEDVIEMDRLLRAAEKKRASEEAKVAAAKRKEERAAAKVQKEAEKAHKAEAAAAAKAQKELDKAQKEADRTAKAEAAAAAKAQKEADRTAKAEAAAAAKAQKEADKKAAAAAKAQKKAARTAGAEAKSAQAAEKTTADGASND